MIIAIDVQYAPQGNALGAGIAFANWGDARAAHAWQVPISDVEPYVSGQFYKRGLPCLLKVLEAAPVEATTIVIDGHVWLGAGQPGLGKHLFDMFWGGIPVIGIAKRPFHEGCAIPWHRPPSTVPLYVTAAGLSDAEASALVSKMHGRNRIPTLLKLVDSLARGH